MKPDGRTLLARLADCSLPPGAFGHRDHVHAAWQCLREAPLPQAARQFSGLLQQYVRHVGAEGKYHHTLTLALMHLIHARMRAAPGADWTSFAAGNADLLADAKSLLGSHYSASLLDSEAARDGFIAPDRATLP